MNPVKKKTDELTLPIDAEKYRTIVTQAREGILVIQRNKRVYYNPRWLEIVGYKLDAYEKSPLFSHAHPEDVETIRLIYEKLIAGEEFSPNLNFRLIAQSGEIKYLDATLSRIEWNGQPAALTLVTEITDRKDTELALKKSEDNFKLLFMESPIPTYTWQVVGDDLILRDYNAAAARITKGRVTELVGITAAKMYQDDQQVLEDFKQCLKEKQSIAKQMDYIFKATGERKHLNVKYTFIPPDIVMVLTEDVTKQRVAERLLEASERRYRTLVDTASDAIYLIDKEGYIVDVNQHACQSTGRTRDEMIGQPVDIMDSDYPPERFLAFWDDKPFDQQFIFETTHRHKDGSLIPVEISGKKFKQDDQTYYYGVARDITERKKSRAALQESEAKFASAFYDSPIPLMLLDYKKNIRVDINEQFERVFGYTRDELVGKKFLKKPLSIDETQIQKSLSLIEENSFFENMPFKIRAKSGEIKDVLVSSYKINSTTDSLFLNSYLDITEQKQAEEALRQSRQLLEESQAIAKVGGWELDIPTNTLFWTAETYRIHELSADTFTPTVETAISYYLPESQAILVDALEESKRTGKRFDLELKLLTAGGHQIDVRANCDATLENGKPVKLSGIFQDITEQKQAEKILRESQQKYKALYDNAPLAYQSLDENGLFIDINPAWLNTLGYSREEVIGHAYTEFLSSEWQNKFEKNFPEFKRRGYIHDIEYKIRHKDGHYVDISFEGYIGKRKDGSFSQTYCVFKDISEQKKSERALEESQERFNLAMKASQDGLFDWNLETNEIYYSPGWKSMLGYEDAELPNDFSIWETNTDPEDVKRSWEMQGKLISKEIDRFEIEFKMKHKDGHWVDILSRAEAVFDETGKAIRIVGTHVDISERKKAEIELEKHRHHLEELVEQRTQEVQQKMKEKNDLFELMVGREVRMGELKDVIQTLRSQLQEHGIKPTVNDPMLRDDEEYGD